MQIILQTLVMYYRHLGGVYIQKSICLSEDINKTKWRKKKYREQFNNFHALKIDEMTNPKGFTSGNII